jgi:hypothetical protein
MYVNAQIIRTSVSIRWLKCAIKTSLLSVHTEKDKRQFVL